MKGHRPGAGEAGLHRHHRRARFRLMTDLPVTCYGPEARNIHGIDESVSIASMKRVATAMAQFIVDWCGVAPAPR